MALKARIAEVVAEANRVALVRARTTVTLARTDEERSVAMAVVEQLSEKAERLAAERLAEMTEASKKDEEKKKEKADRAAAAAAEAARRAEEEKTKKDLKAEMQAVLKNTVDTFPKDLLSLEDCDLDVSRGKYTAPSPAILGESREGGVITRRACSADVYAERVRNVDADVMAFFKTLDPRSTGCIPKAALPYTLATLGIHPSFAELEALTILPGKFVTASELNNIVAIFMPQVKNRESEGVRAALKSGMHALTRFSLSLVGMLPVLRLTREMA